MIVPYMMVIIIIGTQF